MHKCTKYTEWHGHFERAHTQTYTHVGYLCDFGRTMRNCDRLLRFFFVYFFSIYCKASSAMTVHRFIIRIDLELVRAYQNEIVIDPSIYIYSVAERNTLLISDSTNINGQHAAYGWRLGRYTSWSCFLIEFLSTAGHLSSVIVQSLIIISIFILQIELKVRKP